jgi:hypothetical protein
MTDQSASTTSTTSTSGPSGYNAAEITDLAALGAKVEDTIESLEQYIKDHDIFQQWNDALDTIREETGFDYGYYDSPYYHEALFGWNLSLTPHGIEFDTIDRDRDHLIFFIPFTFLSPETRPQCIADLRTKYAALAERQGTAKRAEQEKARDDAERALAKAQANLAALDQS